LASCGVGFRGRNGQGYDGRVARRAVAGCDGPRGFGSDGLCGGFLGSQGYGGCCMAGLPEMGSAFIRPRISRRAVWGAVWRAVTEDWGF
jgi:hypothetical protein